MAEIFLAKMTGAGGFERNVVVKRILPQLLEEPDFVDMFLDEARLAARLTHQNIIQIYDLGTHEGAYFIAMEYLPGEDLHSILRLCRARKELLPVDIAVRIAVDAAHGLHYAHEFSDADGEPLGIVHRDVSPANVLVGYEGQVKVLDFGIAKAGSRLTKTTAGVLKGKYHYMSPEQARGDEIDRRSDIFSIGVTLYEALTGKRPFAADTELAILNAVIAGTFVPLRQLRPEVSPELEAVVNRAMAPDREARPASAKALASELEKVLPAATHADVTGFMRSLVKDEIITWKTRIPSLASLRRSAGDSGGEVESESVRPRRRRRRRWPALLALLVALATVGALGGMAASRIWGRTAPPSGCDRAYGRTDAEDRISLGALLPLGRPKRADGDRQGQLLLLDAMRLALDEINQRDGISGHPFALYVCDNRDDPALIKEQARYLAEHVKVPAVVTSWSDLTLAASSVTLPRGVVTIAMNATSPELTAVKNPGWRLLWRTSSSDVIQGRVMAKLLAGSPELGAPKRVGILYQDAPYGQGLAQSLQSALRQIPGAPSVHAFQYARDSEVGSVLKLLNAHRPDVTVFIGNDDKAKVLNAAAEEPNLRRSAGHRWFLSDSCWSPELFMGLTHPEEIDGAYGTGPGHGASKEYDTFADRYETRFGKELSTQAFIPHSYDAIYLLALAAAWASGPDGKGAVSGTRVAEGLTHLSSGDHFSLTPDAFTAAKVELQAGGSIDVDGTSGKLDFDPATGESAGPVQLWKVTGSGFTIVREIE
jgi:ABC-type branched-subunit amino acid transport system substrate-binding protein